MDNYTRFHGKKQEAKVKFSIFFDVFAAACHFRALDFPI